MTHRTTFALDEATVTRIRALAEQWQVSQAEVIRRVVAQTASAPDPLALLDALHRDQAGLSADTAADFLAQARADRGVWRGR
ncbi:MAG: ribbon-helix-helix protein, CopG family [Gemmatimonadaceae bacterium]|nr:ribbon-helix-helix protein, CopG family [Gemmatimonadaceae bacterium]